MGADIIMNEINNKIYKNDGLIFTPMNEPYPKFKKWDKLLKWKPSELNTIDFYSIKKDNPPINVHAGSIHMKSVITASQTPPLL